MAKKVPEDMIQKVGTCKYCHQQRFVMAIEGETQTEIDRLATEECDCDAATFEAKVQSSVNATAAMVDKKFGYLPERASKAIKAMLYPVAEGTFGSVKINGEESGVSYVIAKKNGFLSVKRVTKEEEIAIEFEKAVDE